MKSAVVLAVDLGAESGRVMGAHWDGARLRLEEAHRFPTGVMPLAGTLRWDLPRLGQEVERGLGLARQKFSATPGSVGVDTWALDYALMSASDELLGLPFGYRDPRTRGGVEALCRRLPRAEIFAASGLQFMEINTLCQWLAHHASSPELFAVARRFLMIPDWLHWSLAGSRVVEFTNATTTQFLDPVTRRWSVDLLNRLHLPTHLLPELVEPGTRLGPLRKDVAERTGLGPVPVIAPATHDTASAVVAVPTERTGRQDWAYISSGTWSLVGVESPRAYLSAEALALNVTNEGGVDGTWRVLKNVMGLWLVQGLRASFERRGGTTDYGALTALAAAAPPRRSVIDPDEARLLNPPDMAIALQTLCRETGQPVPESEGALVRCALESLAGKYARVLSELESLTGTPIALVHIVGGGARNSLLNQLTADAAGRPVIAGPVEATALGNALVQLRGLGELGSLADLRQVVRDSSALVRYEPVPVPRPTPPGPRPPATGHRG